MAMLRHLANLLVIRDVAKISKKAEADCLRLG